MVQCLLGNKVVICQGMGLFVTSQSKFCHVSVQRVVPCQGLGWLSSIRLQGCHLSRYSVVFCQGIWLVEIYKKYKVVISQDILLSSNRVQSWLSLLGYMVVICQDVMLLVICLGGGLSFTRVQGCHLPGYIQCCHLSSYSLVFICQVIGWFVICKCTGLSFSRVQSCNL